MKQLAPQPMGFVEAFKDAVANKYMQFEGRASRSQYWWQHLAILLVSLPANVVAQSAMLPDAQLNMGGSLVGLVSGLVILALIIPTLAVGVRRLHDTDRSGWWLLIGLVPVLGPIVLLVFYVTPGQPEDNQYGPANA